MNLFHNHRHRHSLTWSHHFWYNCICCHDLQKGMIKRVRTLGSCLASRANIIIKAVRVHALVSYTVNGISTIIACSPMSLLVCGEHSRNISSMLRGEGRPTRHLYLEHGMCRRMNGDWECFTFGAKVIIWTLLIDALVPYAANVLVAAVTCCKVSCTGISTLL